MSKLAIYHHNEMDGRFAAALIYEYEKKNYDEIETYEIDYARKIPQVTDADTVYFVDYSFTESENIGYLVRLVDAGAYVVWIDHHKSSAEFVNSGFLDNLVQHNDNIEIFINTKYCATFLCYKYCTENITLGVKNNEMNAVNVPLAINYVDSWDTWKHEFADCTAFMYGFMSKNLDIEDICGAVADNIFDNKATVSPFVNECVSIGKCIIKYLDTDNKRMCETFGFEFNINYFGTLYKCFALNANVNSKAFDSIIARYDIVCPFKFNGEKYIYSLYTQKDDVQCDKIASSLGKYNRLGGGGHSKAAGFQTYQQILSKSCSIVVKEGIFGKTKIKIWK